MFGSRRIAVVAVLMVLLIGILVFASPGSGEYSVSSDGGGSYETEMVPVDPASRVNNVSADPEMRVSRYETVRRRAP